MIIEDKTDTGMHSHQTIRYISGLLKEKKNTYDYIHFCLVKTGSYYFWQRDYYQRDIDIINSDPIEITVIDESSTKRRKELYNAVEIIQKHTRKVIIDYHSLLLPDYTAFFEQMKSVKTQTPWINEYVEYLTILNQKADSSWMEDLNNSSASFFQSLLSSHYSNLAEECDIGLPSGGGKRNYEFRIYGIHGRNLIKSAPAKERYVLLIYTSLQKESVRLCMNLHLFTDSNNIDGYSSGSECKPQALKQEAISIIHRYNNGVFEINCKANAELKLIVPKTINIINNGVLDWSEYKDNLSHLIMIANEIKNVFDN